MHLHWKHRELVKLISKQKTLSFVEDTARLLEYESGGILVAIERVPKGYCLIYYRGKNYRRPISIRPRNLLTKAKALKRSVGMQRHEVFFFFIYHSSIVSIKNSISHMLYYVCHAGSQSAHIWIRENCRTIQITISKSCSCVFLCTKLYFAIFLSHSIYFVNEQCILVYYYPQWSSIWPYPLKWGEYYRLLLREYYELEHLRKWKVGMGLFFTKLNQHFLVIRIQSLQFSFINVKYLKQRKELITTSNN